MVPPLLPSWLWEVHLLPVEGFHQGKAHRSVHKSRSLPLALSYRQQEYPLPEEDIVSKKLQ